MNQDRNFFSEKNLSEARSSLREVGYYLIEGAYDQRFCHSAIEFIEVNASHSGVEINYGGSEVRIWDSHRKSGELQQFFRDCNLSLETLLGHSVKPKTLLAIRNKPIQSDMQDLYVGRWHLDSFLPQYKVFLFLTETSEQAGAFEFIPGSHRNFFKVRMAMKGHYFKMRDLTAGSRAYNRIRDSAIAQLRESGYATRSVVCPQGTVMVVNTSAIHRARPCLERGRAALTAYYG